MHSVMKYESRGDHSASAGREKGKNKRILMNKEGQSCNGLRDVKALTVIDPVTLTNQSKASGLGAAREELEDWWVICHRQTNKETFQQETVCVCVFFALIISNHTI